MRLASGCNEHKEKKQKKPVKIFSSEMVFLFLLFAIWLPNSQLWVITEGTASLT